MNFKYKLAEDKHAGTKGMFKDRLDKWDAEDKDKKAEIAKILLKKYYLKRNVGMVMKHMVKK